MQNRAICAMPLAQTAGDPGQVDVAVRVGQLENPPGPGALGLGKQRSVRGRIRVEFRFQTTSGGKAAH